MELAVRLCWESRGVAKKSLTEVQRARVRTDAQTSGSEEPIRIPLLKASFDRVVALLAVIAFAPLMLLLALSIKINGWLHPEDRGAVLYKEARVSQDQVFELYKFRVLKVAVIEAARQRKGYDHAKPLEGAEENKTRIGRWLQRWYLDELPQLLNVVRSDLSLVGPRPWPIPEYRREVDRGVYRKRLLRPGLTGLVQAHKDELSAMGGDRVLDEAYIEACRTLSPAQLLLFDLQVIVDTFRILAKGQGL
jgi:lipopolysaccharide/colanic/teichoic acid biosynthesis glycosyltransferase